MRVAFAGTPDFAAKILRGLLDSGHEVGLVISQPPARRGRGRKVVASPVAALARIEQVPLLQPETIGNVAEAVGEHEALVVAAYGQILRPDTLYATKHGAWNVHASLLPEYRGAAPIERAIMNGEKETGVSIMRMNEGLDTGPVTLQKKTPLDTRTNAGELTDELASLGSKAIVEALSSLENESLNLTEQDESEATYAAKLTTEDRVIDWDRPVRRIRDQVRALAPRIGARTFHAAFEGPVKILHASIIEAGDKAPSTAPPGSILAAKDGIRVRCGEGYLQVEELQVPGGRPVKVGEYLLGNELRGAFVSRPS